MSEKNQKTAEDGTEETPMSGDERISKIADQTDISRSNEKENNPQGEKQSNHMERSTKVLLQEVEPIAPPTEEPGAQDTLLSGPPQKQGPDEPPSLNGGLLLNQEAESKETQGASPQTQVTDDSTLPQNREPESSETQESKEPQAHNSSENSTATKELYQAKKRERETDQANIEDPTHTEESVLQNTEETDRQEDEIEENNHTDGFQLKLNTGTSIAEEEAVSVSDDKQEPKNSVDDPTQNNFEKSKDQNSTEDMQADPSNTNPEEAGDEISEINSNPDLPVIEQELEIQETQNDKATKGENIETLISESSSPTSDEPTSELPNEQSVHTPNVSNPDFQLQDEKLEKGSLDEMDSTSTEPLVSTETTEQEHTELRESQEPAKSTGQVVFIETADQPAIKDLLRNCRMYQEEFQLDGDLEGAVKEYEYLLNKEKETGCKKQKSAPPPSELSFVKDKEKNQAPLLYAVIADVSEKVPNYNRWRDAVSEFISLTTLSQPESNTSKNKKHKSQSGKQNAPKVSTIKPVKPLKSYRNNIEKLLDQERGTDRAPAPSVTNDYRHLFTCESVIRSTFPEADIFGLVDSTIRGPEDVPQELRHKALFHFLLSINPKTYGVEPSDAWRDFGRLVLAEKQLELAKKAQGPDLHQNIIVKRLDFYKMQNELKEKTEEVEELSTRLSKFASQQLTEGNPNIADLSDTHRPTRLGEMYSQLFDDEWSEAFEAFKPKTEDEDDDIFPDTLYILQDLLTRIFEFCKDQSKSQKTYLEESFAMAIGLTEPKVFKTEDVATETDNTIVVEDAPKLDEKVQDGSLGDTGSFTDKINEEEQVKESQKDPDEKGESSEQLSTPRAKEDENVEKESSNKLEPDKSGKDLSMDTNTNDMQETPSNGTPIESGGESSKTLETDKGNTIPPTDKAENGEDKHVDDAKQNMTSSEQKESEGTDVSRNNGNNRNNNEDQGTQINEQEEHNQQTSKDTVGEEPSNQTTNARSPEKIEEGKEDTEQSDSSQKDQAQVSGGEDKMSESKDYRKNIVYPTIERHARDFRKAAASTSAKTKSKLFIATGLPALIADETVRADVRVLTYVRKCVELCWYMCMQDPPMVIVSPKRGQLVDKALFSFHGRRGKIVEVCVWPALLLHEEGPLVCKGYVLPEERNRNR